MDFFISYASENRVWAQWIAVQLERAGYTTTYQAADFRPGTDFLHEMHSAVQNADRTIVVLTPAYLRSDFGEAEWRAAFAQDPTGSLGRLIPVRVQPCDPPGLLATRVYVDLVDVLESGAQKKLLAAVDKDRKRPSSAAFPGRVRFPGAGPGVANLPQRKRIFTGRADLIGSLYEDLRADGPAAVVSSALHGLGGVGKTMLATEYAHRYASDYDIVWWINAEQPATISAQLFKLGGRLGVAPIAAAEDAVAAVFAELQRRDRWLLIYDNAEQPGSLAGLMPTGGHGHVLVTSRWPDWQGEARTIQVRVWSRPESIAFLKARTAHTDEALLGELADLVGDLPLALEEAAAYLQQTGEDLAAYVELVRDRTQELFVVPDTDQGRVATVWALSLDRVGAEESQAEQLLTLLSFLAPQVPRNLLLAEVNERLTLNRLLQAASRFALIELEQGHIGMHRLVQAVVRGRLAPEAEMRWAGVAIDLVFDLFPKRSWEPQSWSECQRLLPQVIAVSEHAERLAVRGPEAGRLLDAASRYLLETGQYLEARSLAERALHTTETALGPDDREMAWRHDLLGRVMGTMGLSEESRAHFQTAVEIGKACQGFNNWDLVVLRMGLGVALRGAGQLDAAAAEIEQALAIALADPRPQRSVSVVRSNLGLTYWYLGRLDDALEQLELALESGIADSGPRHLSTGKTHTKLGRVLRAQGRFEAAHHHFAEALAISLAVLRPDHPDVGVDHLDLGRVLRDMGEISAARDHLEQALTIGLAAFGPDHDMVAETRHHLEMARASVEHENGDTGDE